MLRVTLFGSVRFRGSASVGLILLIISLGLRPALAATPNTTSPPQTVEVNTTKPGTPDTERSATDTPSTETPPPAPQLQLEDEGPAARKASPISFISSSPTGESRDERPFWKSWIFWAVTGALVASAVGLTIYTASGTSPSLAACPPDVQVSLGCYGSGRGP